MAFGARYIFPNDANPRVAVGVNLPFSGNSVFTPNFTTKEAVKYNKNSQKGLDQYFLSDKVYGLVRNKSIIHDSYSTDRVILSYA